MQEIKPLSHEDDHLFQCRASGKDGDRTYFCFHVQPESGTPHNFPHCVCCATRASVTSHCTPQLHWPGAEHTARRGLLNTVGVEHISLDMAWEVL